MTPENDYPNRITILVGYKTGEEVPRFTAHMKCFGGEVLAVQFGDVMEELDALEAAAPEPSEKMVERVEPTKADWEEAAGSIPGNQPGWQYCMEVSREAYRIAVERGVKT